jgi:antitoxin HigA-1
MAAITEKPARMANPAHPGEILRDLYLEPMSVTITEAAETRGVSRTPVNFSVRNRSRAVAVFPRAARRPSHALSVAGASCVAIPRGSQ